MFLSINCFFSIRFYILNPLSTSLQTFSSLRFQFSRNPSTNGRDSSKYCTNDCVGRSPTFQNIVLNLTTYTFKMRCLKIGYQSLLKGPVKSQVNLQHFHGLFKLSGVVLNIQNAVTSLE